MLEAENFIRIHFEMKYQRWYFVPVRYKERQFQSFSAIEL